MKLSDFIGKHVLTGCQYGTIPKRNEWQDSDPNTVDFILDGKAFSAIEDPSDGYRSSMDEIMESRDISFITNTFEPCEVLGSMRGKSEYGDNNDVVDFIDTTTGKIVLSIGTTNYDDYYPCFEGTFTPENMAINQGKQS